MNKKLSVLMLLFLSVNCASWQELNTRNPANETFTPPQDVTYDATSDSMVIITAVEELLLTSDVTDFKYTAANVYSPKPELGLNELYLQNLLNLISEYETTIKNRELRGVEISKIGGQKYLYDEIVSEIDWLKIKIYNTKRLYNSASLVVSDSVLGALGFPKYFELKKL